MTKVKITVQVLNGATGELREVIANVPARSEQDAVNRLFARARRDDYYYRFLGAHGVIDPATGEQLPVKHENATYWAREGTA